MEQLGSLWSYQEIIDELKQKLLCTTIELESLKVEANEEMRKHKEDMKHLIDLLKMAYKERDEAKDQFQKLLNKLLIPSNSTDLHQILPQTQPESPLIIPMKANSSITESNSNSLSDTYNTNNHHSHGSNPVDSFFDTVTSPDFSSINMGEKYQDYNVSHPVIPKIDPADVAIDNLANGKVLPQKGQLLQAVTEAGPLLQTLLVAGPLPRWRNPPPLQSFKIPPVSLRGCDVAANNGNQQVAAQKSPVNLTSYPDMSRGSSQMCSASMLNFATGASASTGFGSSWQLNSCKRQRFH